MPAVWSNDVKIAVARLKKARVAIVRFYDSSACLHQTQIAYRRE